MKIILNMKGTYSKSVTSAVNQYPALKRTVDLAKKYGIKIVGHFSQLTKKGNVCCHWWLVLEDDKSKEYQRNNELLNWLKNCERYDKNFAEK